MIGADANADSGDEVRLRAWPYPYRAALAICSDLDETPDIDCYLESMRYLNTRAPTRMGRGVGLEIGNSIYFDMATGALSYWNVAEPERARLRQLMRSGHIDCLHSYGDTATTRAHAGRAVDELVRHDCRLPVWIDHGTAITNFGADIMRGEGDVPGAAAYHADLSCANGVEFVWRGRVTSVTGQDVQRRLRGIFCWNHPAASSRTLIKEWMKGQLGVRGSHKYDLHPPNRVLRRTCLRDGRAVWEFLRANPHWGGVSSADSAKGIGAVLSEAMLTRLVSRGGAAVIYTHLGKVWNAREPFAASARSAFERLVRLRDEGRLLVSTTHRLLRFCRARELATVGVEKSGAVPTIRISAALTGAELQGLTVYCQVDRSPRVLVNGMETMVRQNPPDHTGIASVSLPWEPLEYPL